MHFLRITVLILLILSQFSRVVAAELSIETIKELFAARDLQMQEFSVDLAIKTQFRVTHEGPPPWPMGNREGTYRFVSSQEGMSMSGHWKEGIDAAEHFAKASYDGVSTRRIYGDSNTAFGEISAEASKCFPDGTFPLDFVATVQHSRISEIASLLQILEESAESAVLLQSTPRTDTDGFEMKLHVELDGSRGYAVRRVATLMRRVGSDQEWITNVEYRVTSWFAEREGIWLPQSANYRHISWTDQDTSGVIPQTGLVTGKEIQFLSWTLGKVLLDDLTFPDGTLVTDRVNGGQFVVRNVSDQDVMDAIMPAQRVSGPSSLAWIMLLVSTVVVMLFMARLWYVRKV